MESEAQVSLPVAVIINDSSGDNSDTEITGNAGTSTVIEYACIELNIHVLKCNELNTCIALNIHALQCNITCIQTGVPKQGAMWVYPPQ